MAQAPKTVKRAGASARTAPGVVTPTKASKAKAEPVNDEEAAAAQAAAAAEKEAAQAALNEKLLDLKGRIGDTIHTLKEQDSKSAIDARLAWVKVGEQLNEGRALFISEGKNEPNDKKFGDWLVANGFDLLGQRPTRAGAAWLANVFHQKPELYAEFPTESTDGEPLRRSPRTLQAWVRERIYEAFQDAYEMDGEGVAVASEADKDSRKSVAETSMPNVYSALEEQMADAEGAAEAAEKELKAAKGEGARKAASERYNGACNVCDRLEQRKRILDQHTTEELVSYFVGWKPKREAVAFKDCDPAEAAERLFGLLKTHEQFGEVYDALGDLVDALKAKVDADAAAKVDEEGSNLPTDPEGDPDFDAEEGDYIPEDDDDDDADLGDDIDQHFEADEGDDEGDDEEGDD